MALVLNFLNQEYNLLKQIENGTWEQVAHMYGMIVASPKDRETVNWTTVNFAIRHRWDRDTMAKIKRHAWKMAGGIIQQNKKRDQWKTLKDLKKMNDLSDYQKKK